MINETLKQALNRALPNKEFKLRTPDSIHFELKEDGKDLFITLNGNNCLKNMQESAAAFESWGVCIKAILGEEIQKVRIKWETPERKDLHYNRFLYRAIKFEENYNWVILDGPQNDIKNFKNDFKNIVIGYPNGDAKEEPEQEEAILEKKKCNELANLHTKEMVGRQLPVGLYSNFTPNSKKTALTPIAKSQIDLWAIEDDVMRIYELKIPSGTGIGIITELMYYVNIMNDLKKGNITYSPIKKEKRIDFRNVRAVENAFEQKKINKIIGVFYARNMHPWIVTCKDKVISLLNQNTNGIKFEHEII